MHLTNSTAPLSNTKNSLSQIILILSDITKVNFSDFTNLLKSHTRYDTTVITGFAVLFRPLTCKVGKGVKKKIIKQFQYDISSTVP